MFEGLADICDRHNGLWSMEAEKYLLANGKSIKEVCRGIGVSEQTYYRWRKEYGGMQVSQAKRMKELEKENQHLRRAVANLTVDNLILKEASKGNF